MSDSLYAFLGNVQIASMILMTVCYAAVIVAIIFAIVTMFHGIKALKAYVANHPIAKVDQSSSAVPCQSDTQTEEAPVRLEKTETEEQ